MKWITARLRINATLTALILLMNLALITSCQGQQSQFGGGSKPPFAGFQLTLASQGPATTLHINGEPVGWDPYRGMFPQSLLVFGYPILRGTNFFTVTSIFPPNYQHPIFKVPNLLLIAWTQESEKTPINPLAWEKSEDLKEKGPFPDPVQWESDFEMEVALPDPGFEILGSNTNAYAAQARTLALKLAELVQGQDAEGFAKALTLPGKETILNDLPALFPKPDGIKIVKTTCISKPDDLVVEFGKRLVLVHPDPTRAIAETTVILGENKNTAKLNYLNLARLNGKWKVRFAGSVFFDFDMKLLKGTP